MTGRGDLSFLAPPGELSDWRMVLLHDVAEDAGVLSALPGTPADVASARGLEPHAVRVVLEALAVWDVVERDEDGRYALGPDAPDGDLAAQHHHHARSMRLWTSQVADRLHGLALGDGPGPDPTELERWMAALAAYARPAAPAVVDACLARFPDARRVLDLGGGHGEHALAFARQGLQVTMQDRDAVIDLARRSGRLSDAGVELFAGDFFEELPGPPFDIVFSSAVTETYDAERNADLYARLGPATAPGGGVALLVFVRGRNDVAPAFAVQMLAVGRGGDTYSEAEYRSWLEGSGYLDVDVVDIEGRAQSLVMAGR